MKKLLSVFIVLFATVSAHAADDVLLGKARAEGKAVFWIPLPRPGKHEVQVLCRDIGGGTAVQACLEGPGIGGLAESLLPLERSKRGGGLRGQRGQLCRDHRGAVALAG